jgi:hypothetical protein
MRGGSQILIGVVGLILAAIGVIATIAPKEIRCIIRLDSCQEQTAVVTPSPVTVESTKPVSVPATAIPAMLEATSTPLTVASQSTALPITDVSDPFRDSASRKCNEFEGKPKKIDALTNQLLEEWRRIGDTGDRNTVGRIIYCEIHQIPNFKGFVSGDSIPSGAIITADIGSNWTKRYAGSLEGVAYYEGGGWGVFRTLKSLTMQNAGGQYWLIN